MNQTPSNSTTTPARPGGPAAEGAVEVWSAWVDRMPPDEASLAVLDERELMRAGRFRLGRDRDRFVARRAFLRRVLGARVGVPPTDIELRVTAHGRPSLDAAWGLDFSTSHDDGLAVIAITSGGRVGVDVERVRHIEDALDLARTHMAPDESAWLRSVRPDARSRAFLELWTRKESVVKALGGGLSIPLAGFDCSMMDAAGVGHPIGVPGGATWTVVALEGFGSHVASVAVEGTRASVRSMGELEVAA